MSEKQFIFETLRRLGDCIVKTFGRNCEIAIHDFDDLTHSLIYIAGSLTNRALGAPITDLVVKAWRQEGDNVKDICNYPTTTKSGKILKSSTFFIRNKKGKIIGAFCINFNITDFMNSVSLVEEFIRTVALNEYKSETFAFSVGDTIESLIEQAVAEVGRQPSTMSKQERVRLVSILESKGAFMIKGVLEDLALKMGVSKYSVYEYLKEVRAAKDKNVL